MYATFGTVAPFSIRIFLVAYGRIPYFLFICFLFTDKIFSCIHH